MPALLAWDGSDIPLLGVGETHAFERAEGMITFALEENRLSFMINNAAEMASGLRIRARAFGAWRRK
jgi:hypothetical protein